MSAEEPTNAEIMTVLLRQTEVLQIHAERFDAIDRRFDSVDRRFDSVDRRFDSLDRKVDQIGKDVVALKVNQAFTERRMDDLHEWATRHEADPNAHGRAA
jgi:tetrahydromethanopterin S-methyltransferase subunit G